MQAKHESITMSVNSREMCDEKQSRLAEALAPADAESLLRRILKHFYVNNEGHLEWAFIEGVTLAEIEGIDFQTEILKLKGNFDAEAN